MPSSQNSADHRGAEQVFFGERMPMGALENAYLNSVALVVEAEGQGHSWKKSLQETMIKSW